MSFSVKVSPFFRKLWPSADSEWFRACWSQNEAQAPKFERSEPKASSESLDVERFPDVPGGDLSRIGGAEAARGIYLFELRYGQGSSGFEVPSLTQCPAALPFAKFVDGETESGLCRTPLPKFAPARDALTRDVVIKLVKKGSDEHRIYQDLQDCNARSENALQGVIPPVAILDSQYEFSFVVMPRWGSYAPLAAFETVGGVLSLMRSLLKKDEFRRALEEHRQGPDAVHALMDFDRSLKLPLDTPLDACRLPENESLVSGTPFGPLDFSLGEHDYDPFAFDVGCLGAIFQLNYADIVPIIPMLAPLFDQMTTHVVSERSKAADALAFFEDATRQLPSDVLCAEVKLVQSWDPVNDPNVYWSKLPPDFCKTPGIYRTPPQSLVRRILNAIAEYRIGWRILLFVRHVLRV
uniref:Methyltransf_11 domain-containing protein n=1 Tax=Ganoderma boninense TaxID=34458 RepID=A0A5K1JYU7_9APHY|nr:Methyltransf_11 domain-containing protein [Ganoderma boninense]